MPPNATHRHPSHPLPIHPHHPLADQPKSMAKKGVMAQLLLFIFGREEMAKKRSVPPKVKSKQKCEAFSVRGWVVILLGWWAVGGWALPGCSRHC